LQTGWNGEKRAENPVGLYVPLLRWTRQSKNTQKRLHSCVLAQPKGASILEKLGDNACNALKIVVPAAYPTAGLKTPAKTIIHNAILNYLGNIRLGW